MGLFFELYVRVLPGSFLSLPSYPAAAPLSVTSYSFSLSTQPDQCCYGPPGPRCSQVMPSSPDLTGRAAGKPDLTCHHHAPPRAARPAPPHPATLPQICWKDVKGTPPPGHHGHAVPGLRPSPAAGRCRAMRWFHSLLSLVTSCHRAPRRHKLPCSRASTAVHNPAE